MSFRPFGDVTGSTAEFEMELGGTVVIEGPPVGGGLVSRRSRPVSRSRLAACACRSSPTGRSFCRVRTGFGRRMPPSTVNDPIATVIAIAAVIAALVIAPLPWRTERLRFRRLYIPPISGHHLSNPDDRCHSGPTHAICRLFVRSRPPVRHRQHLVLRRRSPLRSPLPGCFRPRVARDRSGSRNGDADGVSTSSSSAATLSSSPHRWACWAA